MSRRVTNLVLVALVAPTFVSACAAVPEDDAGDVAFVHQAVQTLLCRRPRGVNEVQALVDIITENGTDGRAAIVDVLLVQPEFVDCWTTILVDSMKMQRAGELGQLETCVNEPVFILDATGQPCARYADCSVEVDALVNHLALIPATAVALGADWNLHDAVRAGLLTQDLHTAWRPWLFALAGAPATSVTFNATANEIRDNFLSSAFGVNVDCIGCHSSTYSKSEVYPEYSTPLDPANPIDPDVHQNSWDRTSNYGFDLHGGAFWTGSAVPNNGSPGSVLFQATCTGCHGVTGETLPEGTWGVCANTGTTPKKLTERVPLMTVDEIKAQILLGGGCMPAQPLTDPDAQTLADFLRDELGGWQDLRRYVDAGQFTGISGPWGMPPALCGFGFTPDLVDDGSSYSIGGHATTFTDVSDVTWVVKHGLAALPNETGAAPPHAQAGPSLPDMADPRAAVAGLVVANIADDLLEELTGARTSVAHGLPRVRGQSEAMRGLVSKLVVSDASGVHISLQNALKEAMLSKYFNRRTPKEMSPAAPVLTDWAYQMGMYFNPWAATETWTPTDDGDNLNGQGDVVHRRSPNQLAWSLHHDLGWPRPAVWPTNVDFPTKELMRDIGRYESKLRPGTTVWRFDSLLLWEEALAACENPDPATDDFITVLVDTNHAAATLGDLALSLKDRILQDPTFSSDPFGPAGETEDVLVAAFLDSALPNPAATLASPASTWTLTKVTNAMRKYCGALLVSPDYLMANLPTVTTVPPAPTYVTCLPGEDCTLTDLAAHYCTDLPAPWVCPP